MTSWRDPYLPLALVFRALADPARLSIVEFLAEGGKPVGVIAAGVGLSQATVSQHLANLREAGLVSCRADGARRVYSIADTQALAALLGAGLVLAPDAGVDSGWRGRLGFSARRRRPRYQNGMPP